MTRRIVRGGLRRLRSTAREWRIAGGIPTKRARDLIEDSAIFDPDWYIARHGDLGAWANDPVGHYLHEGAARGLNPSPLFWTDWFTAAHPFAVRNGTNALASYLDGIGERPNPLFDDVWYRMQPAGQGVTCALDHYIAEGAALGLDPHPLFHTRWYAERCPGVQGNPLSHYLEHGAQNGCDPSPYFQTAWYRARYPDVALAGQNPLAHFLLGGARDLRDPSPDFSLARYLHRNPRARDSTIHPLVYAVLHDEATEPPPPAPPPPVAAPPLSVTCIVPNYRHAAFLRERLDSIFAQTVLPDAILFLDDASPDDSLAIARDYQARSPVPFTIVANETNAGSPFGQWAKGIAMADGDLIWIAESDDRCAPDLLATLKAAFADDSVTLSYCQSRPITADGAAMAHDYRYHTDDLSIDRWLQPYVADGRDEVIAALAYKNTIPNGSAALFRRRVAMDVLPRFADFRQAGDWMLYLACAAAGRVAFMPAVLNDHRRHAQALTLELGASLQPLVEAVRLRLDTIKRFDLPRESAFASLACIALEYHERTGGDPAATPLDQLPLIAPQIAALQAEIARLSGAPGGPRRLLILDALPGPDQLGPGDMIAMDRPPADEPPWADAVAPALWLEGAARAAAWSQSALWIGNDCATDPRRIAVLAALLRLHGITSVEASGGPTARRLAEAVKARAGL